MKTKPPVNWLCDRQAITQGIHKSRLSKLVRNVINPHTHTPKKKKKRESKIQPKEECGHRPQREGKGKKKKKNISVTSEHREIARIKLLEY